MRVIELARRRNNYPITDRLKGCNGLITTKAQLATQLTVPETNLANVIFDNANNEIRWHSRNNYSISRFFSFSNRNEAEQFQKDLSQVVEEFESSRLVGSSPFLFSLSEIKVLKLANFENIVQNGLREMTKLLQLEMPSLRTVDIEGLVGSGVNNGNVDIVVDFPNIQSGLRNFGNLVANLGNRFVFQNSVENTLTETNIFLQYWLNTPNIPFNQSRLRGGILPEQFFRDMRKLSDPLDLPQVTEVPQLCFMDCFELPSIKLPNATTINGFAILRNATSLTYIDIRSCTFLSNSSNITNTPNDGTIEANIALQDWQGSGSPHPVIQVLITKNWTVNYY